MTGVVFLISVPTKPHEEVLVKKIKNRVALSRTTSVSSKQSGKQEEFVVNSSDNLCAPGSSIGSECTSRLESFAAQFCDENGDVLNPDADSKLCMEEILVDHLKRLKITNFTWTKCANGKYVQVTFPLESRDRCEEVLELLREHKIGKRFNSVVSVIPCTIYYHYSVEDAKEVDDFIDADSENYKNANDKLKETAWNRFVTSIRARLTVAQVVENIKADALLTFDFICLLTIAAVLCAIGLVENSDVTLLSSMLISPMMGPVMAGTFGTVIRDRNLLKTGVQNELIGLGIATLIGFVYGVLITVATDKYGQNDWPTFEMISRGEMRSLWIGCLVALLSGAAVALGILGDNIASLVGVAISTSLMPPAVNAGLLWSVAFVCYTSGNETKFALLKETEIYSKNKLMELALLGAVSLCLTFVNIVCIYVAGILVFKVKEVAPIASRDSARRHFWKYDIKITRDYNKTMQNEDAKNLHNEFCREMSNVGYQGNDLHNPCRFYKQFGHHRHHSVDLTEEMMQSNLHRFTWSPYQYPGAGIRKSQMKSKKTLKFNILGKGSKRVPRTLDDIFPTQSTNLPGKPDEGRTVGEKKICCHTKTFTVTPCVPDPLLMGQ